MDGSAIEINNDGNKINNEKTISKSFEYKTKIIGSTTNDNNTLSTEVAVPLKYLINFWRFLDLESAKLRVLRAPCVPTCLACLRAHVPTCLACLRAHVPCELCVPTCSRNVTKISFQ